MNTNDKEFIVSRIRENYTEKGSDDVELLCALDAKVRRPANIFAYTFGIVGSLILGSGMSLVMTDISEKLNISSPTPLGIGIGIFGLVAICVNYPIYKRILSARRLKYADKVIALSDKIIKG